MDITFELGSMYSAYESLSNYIDMLDDFEDNIAMESDGATKGIPWYKKIQIAFQNMLRTIKTKWKEFWMKLQEKTGLGHSVPPKAAQFILSMLKTVDKQKSLLKQIDFVNYSQNSSMVISKVEKAIEDINAKTTEFTKGFELKKIKLEFQRGIRNGTVNITGDSIVRSLRNAISISLDDFQNTIDSILKDSEKYADESKKAANQACSICAKLLKITDAHTRYIISSSAVVTHMEKK